MENFIGIEQDEEDIIKTILESKEFDFRDSFSQPGNLEGKAFIRPMFEKMSSFSHKKLYKNKKNFKKSYSTPGFSIFFFFPFQI
jgi:hypothetical protein